MTHVLPPDVDLPSALSAPTVSLFRNRNFVYLWSAQLLSQLASNMVLAALIATVAGSTGSNTAVALLILTFLLPAVLFSTIGGALVERGDAKLIMLIANIARAVGVAAFIFVAPSTRSAILPLLLLLNFAVASASAFFAPAELTALPRIVPREKLLAANSFFIMTVNATFAVGFGFIGPLLLITTGPIMVYLVVAVMFGLAALAILPLPHVRATTAHAAAESLRGAVRELYDELKEGVAFIRNTRSIAWNLAYLGVSASLIGVLGAIGPGFATDILLLSEQDFFFIMGPAGVGAVAGIVFLNTRRGGFNAARIIDRGMLALGAALLGLALVKPIALLLSPATGGLARLSPLLAPLAELLAPVLVIAALAGAAYAFVAIPSQTALQRDLPEEVRGRIFGILNMLLSLASFFPVLLAPLAADIVNIFFPGVGIPVVMAALGIAVLALGLASLRRHRNGED